MESKSQKQSLKKKIAIATMAASLGVSLGVPVGDVLADGQSTGNSSPMTVQQKGNPAPNVPKTSNQINESKQGKERPAQIKGEPTKEDRESTQSKVGYKVEPKPEQNKK